jgi:hypothetical protein
VLITYDNIVSVLLDEVPVFHPDEDDIGDNLVYLVMSDLMRFIRSLSERPESSEVLERTFRFVERALRDSDPRVVDLMRDTLVELSSMPDSLQFKEYIGRATRKLLKNIERSN